MFSELPNCLHRRRAAGSRVIRIAGAAIAGISTLFLLAACDPATPVETSTSTEFVPDMPEEMPVVIEEVKETPEQTALSRRAIIKLQKLLAARGYDPGPIDGYPGLMTANAIRHYQSDNGIRRNGRISRELLERLEKPGDAGQESAAARKLKPLIVGYEKTDALPSYEAGDVFIYSNGRIETVVRVGGNRVVWRGNDGSGYTSHPNFMLPRITWHEGSGAGRRSAETDAGDLWPIPPGEDRSFQVRIKTDGGSQVTTQEWRCRGEGENRITVAAGIFDTVVFSCERSNPAKAEWKRRVWYYAPSVRHYVRRDELKNGAKRASRVELVAVRPGGREWPPAARAGLGWAVEDTLQNKPTGEEVVWRSTGVDTEFLIRPTMEPVRRNGKLCRSFVLVRGQLETARVYPAMACRDPGTGRWLVPGANDDSIIGPVVSGNP